MALLISGCSTGIRIEYEDEEYVGEYTIRLQHSDATVKDERYMVYLRFYDQGSRFIIDDEVAYHLYFEIPVTPNEDSLDPSNVVFFRRWTFGPEYAGYLDISELKVAKSRGPSLSISLIAESSFVYAGWGGNPHMKVSFEDLKVPLNPELEKDYAEALRAPGFAQTFRERYGREWRGPSDIPPDAD